MTKPVRLREPTGTEVWKDEFDDHSIGPWWVEINNCGSHGNWKEGGGVLSFAHTAVASGNSAYSHWLVKDISSFGGYPLMAEYYVRMTGVYNSTYHMQLDAWSSTNTSGTGEQCVMMGHNSGSSHGDVLGNRDWSNWVTQNGYTNFNPYCFQESGYYIRHFWEAANTFRVSVSTDGISWLSSGTYAKTVTPSYFALGCTNYNTVSAFVCTYYYLRFYSIATASEYVRPYDQL